MAMNGTALGDAIVTALESVDPSMTPDQIAQLRTSWEAICNVIVPYIQANAVVNPGSFSNSGGSVTGTGTIS